jgi:hypothetical protein
MFIHFMSLSGAKGFEEFDPRLQQAPAGAIPNAIQQPLEQSGQPAAQPVIPNAGTVAQPVA